MVEENVPAPTPTRSDKQILPFNAWLPVGKGNLLLDLQKLQKNPIFRILVDILQNTNLFRAFTTSANISTIYIQRFWNTFVQDANLNIPTKKPTTHVRIRQKSQENRQKRANTDTRTEECAKAGSQSQKVNPQSKSTLDDKDPKISNSVP
ncbi:hypothetical protein Tco_1035045 [Tanacetum coccineum]